MSGRKTFVGGDILLASELNGFLMDQSVMVFDDAAARGSAIPSPSEGMVTYLKDTNLVEAYTGAAFEPVSQPAIVQIVSANKTDIFSTSSTTLTDVTGLTASITPASASNKILVTVSLGVGVSANNIQYGFTIADGSDNNLIAAGSPGSRTPVIQMRNDNGESLTMLSYVFTHEPATTSAFTYKVRAQTESGTLFVNRSGADTDSANFGRSVAQITLMEVAA